MVRFRTARFASVLLLLAAFQLPAAHAESKDMIQLQTQVQQLIDAVARLQQSNDERMGVLKDLVQQTADSMNKMAVTIDGLKISMQNLQDANGAKADQLAGQVQALNDSLDELKARMARMEKSINEVQSQQQSTAAMLNNLPGAGAPAAAGTAPGAGPATPSGAAPETAPPPAADTAVPQDAGVPAAAAPIVPAAPSVGEMYKAAYTDYIGAKYPLAASEFNDLIKAYPDDNLSGNAYFYIGEIDVRQGKLSAAVKSYDQLLERYLDNPKIPAAHLHKAYALIALKQNEAGVRELRALIQRFPTSPEASQARGKLSQMRMTVVPREQP
jgi:TolA-binding protein